MNIHFQSLTNYLPKNGENYSNWEKSVKALTSIEICRENILRFDKEKQKRKWKEGKSKRNEFEIICNNILGKIVSKNSEKCVK